MPTWTGSRLPTFAPRSTPPLITSSTHRCRRPREDFARVRRRPVDLLHGWGKTEWERTIVDPRGGAFTLLEVCQLVTRHAMAHVAQIRNLTALLPEPEDLGPPRQG